MAARGWGIQPGEVWQMTVSEILTEFEMRGGDGDTYAGGMTAGDIDNIKSESAKLRAQVKAKRNGTETP